MVQPPTDRYTGEERQEDGAGQTPVEATSAPQQASDAPAPSSAKAFCDEQAAKAGKDELVAEGYVGSHTTRLAGKTAPPGRFILETMHGEITLQYWDRPKGLGEPNHSYARATYKVVSNTSKGKTYQNNELLNLEWVAAP